MALFNQIGIEYIKQTKNDSALVYLNPSLPLAEKLADREGFIKLGRR